MDLAAGADVVLSSWQRPLAEGLELLHTQLLPQRMASLQQIRVDGLARNSCTREENTYSRLRNKKASKSPTFIFFILI